MADRNENEAFFRVEKVIINHPKFGLTRCLVVDERPGEMRLRPEALDTFPETETFAEDWFPSSAVVEIINDE